MPGLGNWISVARGTCQNQGAAAFLGRLGAHLTVPFVWLWIRATSRPPEFQLAGRTYTAFWHPYNRTWRNERGVEIAIARAVIAATPAERVLEIGNVLTWYGSRGHTVVDLYERGEGILNEDVADLSLPKKFDVIVSVSTLEHVGWDEQPRDPDKLLRSIEALKAHLSPEGVLFVTMPVGQNPFVNRFISENRLGFSETRFLRRISKDNHWVEATWDEVKECTWGDPYPCASALILGWYRAELFVTEAVAAAGDTPVPVGGRQ